MALTKAASFLSQAIAQSEQTEQAGQQALKINIGTPRRGVRGQRAADPTRLEQGEGVVEFVEGKPFLNFGRMLASQIGVPLPYQFRQREENALAYEQQQEDERKFAAGIEDQIAQDALQLESFGNASLDDQVANLRRDVSQAAYEYQSFRDPEMKAGALRRLQELQAGSNKLIGDNAEAGLREARTFAREELKDLRRSINGAQSAYSERKASAMAMHSRLALIGSGEIKENSPEGQAILTEAFERMTRYQDSIGGLVGGAGNVIGMAPNPYMMAGGAALSVLGKYLEREGSKLDYSTVIKAFQAQQDALDKFSYGDGEGYQGFLPQLNGALEQQETFARDKLGIPIDSSWRSTQFEFPTNAPMPASIRPTTPPTAAAPNTGTMGAPMNPREQAFRDAARRPTR